MAMRDNLFIDTGGFYLLMVEKAPQHDKATTALFNQTKRGRIVTSDYVISETATLLVARGYKLQQKKFLNMVRTSEALAIERIGAELFDKTIEFALKHFDQEYSFTDCTSFLLMRKLKIRRVMTTDRHFAEQGFVVEPSVA
ncbi:MAG: 23S rRNA-specific endonuclease VapC20 [Turneriella sp.]|nr:23S rRNA-specific endonuclease VapC20 [Turneriella sp.]